jgi:FkbM family methyltransferase
VNFVRFEVQIQPTEQPYFAFDFRGSYLPLFRHEQMHKEPVPDLVGDRLVIEIGANVGMWTMRMARLYPECHFIAYEPYPVNVRHLMMGLEVNQLKNVSVVDCAVTNDGRDVILVMEPRNSGTASVFNTLESEMYPRQKVHSLKLNEVCDHHASIDALRVDIEGGEFSLFEGFSHWDKLKKVYINLCPRYAGFTDQEREYAVKRLLKLLRDKIGTENVIVECMEEKFRGL